MKTKLTVIFIGVILIFTPLSNLVHSVGDSGNKAPLGVELLPTPSLATNLTHRVGDVLETNTSDGFVIGDRPYTSTIEIENSSLSQSQIDISSGVWPYSNMSSDFGMNISQNTLSMNFTGGVLARFDQSLNMSFNDPRDTISFQLESVNFPYVEDEFALLEMEIRFKVDGYEFFYVFLLDLSNSTKSTFESTNSPSTERTFYIEKGLPYTFNSSQIKADIGTDSDLTIEYLTIFAYRPNGINISFSFASLDISRYLPLSQIDNRLVKGSSFSLPKDTRLNITLPESSSLEIIYKRTWDELIPADLNLDFRYGGVSVSGTVVLPSVSFHPMNELLFPSVIMDVRSNIDGSVIYGTIDLNSSSGNEISILFTGNLNSTTINIPFSGTQNQTYSINNEFDVVFGLLISPLGEKVEVSVSDSLSFTIPVSWSNGSSQVVGVDKDGYVVIYYLFIPSLPIEISIGRTFSMDPFQSFSIEYTVNSQNVSIFPRIIIEEKGLEFSYNETHITFPPDSLPSGNNTLLLIFSKTGYGNSSVRIFIKVLDPIIKWDAQGIEGYPNYTKIRIEISEYDSIELPVFVYTSYTPDIQIYSKYTDLVLYTPDTEINIGLRIGNYTFSKMVTVPSVAVVFSTETLIFNVTDHPVEVSSDGSIGVVLVGGFGIVSFSSVGFIILRIIRKDKYVPV